MLLTNVLLINLIPNYIEGSPIAKVVYSLLRHEKPTLLRVTLKELLNAI